MNTKRTWARLVALLLTVGVFAAACGDDGDSSDNGGSDNGGTTTESGAGGSDDGMEPQPGGTLNIGMYSEPRGLDPATGSGSGTAGGTEMIALYDTITRWNPETRDYDMRTAESVTSNEDFTEWTLVLKDGIKFRDGTDYNADAVKVNIDRYLSAVNVTTSRSWLTYIVGSADNVTVIDPLTVSFTLDKAYSGFPALLAHSPGMILSPAKLAELGDPADPGYKDKASEFNLNPVGAGAGPFELVSFVKGEGITMKKDPTYYGDEAFVDEVKFVNLNSSDKTLDALKTGTLNIGFLRSAPSVDAARKDDSLEGVDSFIQAGGLLLMNQGVKLTCTGGQPEPLCTGQPDGEIATQPNTANAKVRAAIVAAIDPKVIDERVNSGLGLPFNGLIDENFTESPGVDGVPTDPERAKELLDEAKAEGASGEVRITCTNQPERVALATTVETQLSAVGFDVTATSDIDVATQIGEILTKKDFDLACWGYSMPDDETAALSLVQNLWSESPTNRVGYANPAWDAALDEALAGADPAARTAAYKKLAELWNEDNPSIVYETVVERVAWADNVHGVYLTENTMFYVDKAWIEQ